MCSRVSLLLLLVSVACSSAAPPPPPPLRCAELAHGTSTPSLLTPLRPTHSVLDRVARTHDDVLWTWRGEHGLDSPREALQQLDADHTLASTPGMNERGLLVRDATWEAQWQDHGRQLTLRAARDPSSHAFELQCQGPDSTPIRLAVARERGLVPEWLPAALATQLESIDLLGVTGGPRSFQIDVATEGRARLVSALRAARFEIDDQQHVLNARSESGQEAVLVTEGDRVILNVEPPRPAEPTPIPVSGTVSIDAMEDESGSGLFDSAIVLRVLSVRRRALGQCWTAANVEGRVLVRFTARPEGSVADVEVIEDAGGNESLASCIEAAVSAIRFNPGPEGGSVTYTVPIRFARRG